MHLRDDPVEASVDYLAVIDDIEWRSLHSLYPRIHFD